MVKLRNLSKVTQLVKGTAKIQRQVVKIKMNKLRQSFRRKKDVYVPEASRPHQWQTDEEGVRTGKCSFPVKYLGHVEVDESRGMHICEDAVKRLKAFLSVPQIGTLIEPSLTSVAMAPLGAGSVIASWLSRTRVRD